MFHYRVGPEIPLHHTKSQIPVSIRVNPTDTFGDTCSAPLVTWLRCDVWYTQSTPTVSGRYTISWSKEMILDIGKALANELHDL